MLYYCCISCCCFCGWGCCWWCCLKIAATATWTIFFKLGRKEHLFDFFIVWKCKWSFFSLSPLHSDEKLDNENTTRTRVKKKAVLANCPSSALKCVLQKKKQEKIDAKKREREREERKISKKTDWSYSQVDKGLMELLREEKSEEENVSFFIRIKNSSRWNRAVIFV